LRRGNMESDNKFVGRLEKDISRILDIRDETSTFSNNPLLYIVAFDKKFLDLGHVQHISSTIPKKNGKPMINLIYEYTY